VAADGTVWVAQNTRYDDYQPPLVGYAADGSVVATLGADAADTFGGMSNPAYLALLDDLVLVTIGDFGWASMFRTDGPFVGSFGTTDPLAMRFPSGIAISGTDIYVAETWTSTILHYGART
jgi:hypothetical protein